ncbi:MAG: hypothetical protein RIS64_189 [Bacteroidota bacterium]|jgi:hypothetical protein
MKTIQLFAIVALCTIFAQTVHAQQKRSQVTIGGVTYNSALSCSDWDTWADRQAKGDKDKAAKIKSDLNCQETNGRSTIQLPDCASAFVKKNSGNTAVMDQLILDAVSLAPKDFCVKYALAAEAIKVIEPVKAKKQ